MVSSEVRFVYSGQWWDACGLWLKIITSCNQPQTIDFIWDLECSASLPTMLRSLRKDYLRHWQEEFRNDAVCRDTKSSGMSSWREDPLFPISIGYVIHVLPPMESPLQVIRKERRYQKKNLMSFAGIDKYVFIAGTNSTILQYSENDIAGNSNKSGACKDQLPVLSVSVFSPSFRTLDSHAWLMVYRENPTTGPMPG